MQQFEIPTVHSIPRVHAAVGFGVIGAVVKDLVDLEATPVLQQVADNASDVLRVIQAAVWAPLKL